VLACPPALPLNVLRGGMGGAVGPCGVQVVLAACNVAGRLASVALLHGTQPLHLLFRGGSKDTPHSTCGP
jgi:hypothetical protein